MPVAGEPGKTELQIQRLKQRAMDLRMRGMTYERIAEALVNEGLTTSCSAVQAHSFVKQVLQARAKETQEAADHVLQLEVERLDKVLEGIWDRVEAGSLDHVETYIKLAARRSRLLGLDAPVRVEKTIDDTRKLTDAQIAQRAKELAEKLQAKLMSPKPALEVQNVVEGEVVDAQGASPRGSQVDPESTG